MALLQQWRDMAYSETANKGDLQRLWSAYFQKEKEIYAQLLNSFLKRGGWGFSSVVERLPRKRKALGSVPSSEKKNQKKKKKKKKDFHPNHLEASLCVFGTRC